MIIQFVDFTYKDYKNKKVNIELGETLYALKYCGLSDTNNPILNIEPFIVETITGIVMNAKPIPIDVLIINEKYMADLQCYKKDIAVPKVFKRNNYIVFKNLKDAQKFKEKTEKLNIRKFY